jgi:hypothetical protein
MMDIHGCSKMNIYRVFQKVQGVPKSIGCSKKQGGAENNIYIQGV